MDNDYAIQYIGKTVNVKMDRPMGSRHPRSGLFYRKRLNFDSLVVF